MIPSIQNSLSHSGKSFFLDKKHLIASGDKNLLRVLAGRICLLPGFHSFILEHTNNSESAILRLETLPFENEFDEHYQLEIQEERIDIRGSRIGLAHGLTTLWQIIREQAFALPSDDVCKLDCILIDDSPQFHYRGVMLDCSRHFFQISEIRKILEVMGLLKLNVLHWHLSDDQGYRIESKAFPKLNTIGSYRNEDGALTGGFYSHIDIQEIVQFASDRGIHIIPEIDMPGHTTAILASYPELGSDTSGNSVLEIPSDGGIFRNILCPVKEETLNFAKSILDEVCSLFPFSYIHLGGDEAPKDEWRSSPLCQKKIRELHLPDENSLQIWFVNQLLDYLAHKDRKGIVWLEPGMTEGYRKNCVFQYWRKEAEQADELEKFLNNGQKTDGSRMIIWSPQDRFYLDYVPAMNPMEGIFKAVDSLAVHPSLYHHVIGFECPLWTEMIETDSCLEQMLFPRLIAEAQIGWDTEAALSYGAFIEEIRNILPLLDVMNVAYWPLDTVDPEGKEKARQIISLYLPFFQKKKACLSEEEWIELQKVFSWILSDRMQKNFPANEVSAILDQLFSIS